MSTMKQDQRINLKDHSKRFKSKDLLAIISNKVHEKRAETLSKHRVDLNSTNAKQIGLEILSNVMSDYCIQIGDDLALNLANDILNNSSSTSNDSSMILVKCTEEDQANKDDSLESSGITDKENMFDHDTYATDSSAIFQASMDNIEAEEMDTIDPHKANNPRSCYDESELIDMLGLEVYLEIMCNIEEEIRNELSPFPSSESLLQENSNDITFNENTSNNSNSNINMNTSSAAMNGCTNSLPYAAACELSEEYEFMDELQSDQLICPNCRYVHTDCI